jgi:L,D-peptidoglycan transpeptidase YkuD (ErfK/YbiS/YcfS/YnhG family)
VSGRVSHQLSANLRKPAPDRPAPHEDVIGDLRLAVSSRAATRGMLRVGGRMLRCAIGRGGCRVLKREGDGATPTGIWTVRAIFYRADKVLRPRTQLSMHVIARNAGWCDAPGDRNYNRFVRHPYPASAEQLWRDDDLYNIVLVLGHNDRPRKRGCGSAIFMHLARPGYRPTEGCVALSERDLRVVVAHVGRRSRIHVP